MFSAPDFRLVVTAVAAWWRSQGFGAIPGNGRAVEGVKGVGYRAGGVVYRVLGGKYEGLQRL